MLGLHEIFCVIIIQCTDGNNIKQVEQWAFGNIFATFDTPIVFVVDTGGFYSGMLQMIYRRS